MSPGPPPLPILPRIVYTCVSNIYLAEGVLLLQAFFYTTRQYKPNPYLYIYTFTRIQGYKNTRIHKYMNTRIQEYKNTWIQEYKNTRIQEYKNTWIQEYKNTIIQEYKNTRIQ